MRETIDRLKPLFTEKPLVENPPKIPEKIRWVQPKLVCEGASAEWTEDEQLSPDKFLGWRDDKDPKESSCSPLESPKFEFLEIRRLRDHRFPPTG